jgi:hypothetical protein
MQILNMPGLDKISQNQLLLNQDYQDIKEPNCRLLEINKILVDTADISYKSIRY